MKKILKKIIPAMVCASVCMATMVGASAETFTDMPNDWTTQALENAVANGLISGMGDGTIAPDANITRAQMGAIIVRALGATETADITAYSDMAPEAWYYAEMQKAVYMGAFSGDDQMKMNPENNITFQECFTVLSRVFGLHYREKVSAASVLGVEITKKTEDALVTQYLSEYYNTILAAYPDGGEVADWAKPYYVALVNGGYWTGIDGYLTPTAYITRAQFAVVMDNLIKNYISEPGTYTELPEGNTVIRCNDVVLENVTTAHDLYIADGVAANKITINNITVGGRLVFRGCASPGIVEMTAENGNKYTKLYYTEVGAAPTGKAFDIQVIAPYIYVDLQGITATKCYSVKDTCIKLGAISPM